MKCLFDGYLIDNRNDKLKTDKNTTLTRHWKMVKLGEVCKIYQPKTISKKQLVPDGQFFVYGANGVIGKFDKFNHQDSEILVTCRGATCGSVNVSEPNSWINGNAMVVQPSIDNLTKPFIRYFFESINLSKVITGSAQPQITRTSLSPIDFPLPPLPEQHRIVAKIEELFSELDNGIANLKKAKAQLKVYRQSEILKAVTGGLTEFFRKENPYLISSEELFQKIQEKLDIAYEHACQKAKVEGKRKPKDQRKNKKAIDVKTVLPEIPHNWKYFRLEDITYLVTDGTHHTPKYTDSGVKFLSVKNVRPFFFKIDSLKHISFEEHSKLIQRCYPEHGDILYTKVGATYGYACKVDLDFEFSIFVSLCLIKPVYEYLSSDFLELLMNSELVFKQARQRVSGSGVPDLHLIEIRDFKVPLPPVEEQHQIIQEIESRLSVADKLEETIEQSLKQSEALRQSILKRAFEGKLVPQEETDR